MTKNELFEAIKANTNEAEFETLGVTMRSEKSVLQGLFDQLNIETHEHNEPLTLEPDQKLPTNGRESSTKATANGNVNEPEVTPEPEVKTGTDDFDELLGKVKGASAGQPKEKSNQPLITKEKRKRKRGESSPDSFRIEGYILLLATDTVFPTLLAFINNLIDKKHKKISADELRLAEKDFNKLEPLADQAADYMTIHLNPVAGFFLISAFMYTNNIIAIKMELPTNGWESSPKPDSPK
jgi:hypothetical protein